MSVSERKFGTLPTGEEVKIYHLENKKGAYVEVLQYGAILVKERRSEGCGSWI